MPKREPLSVAGVDTVGPYTLLRLERGGLEPGIPGQFFMLQPPEHVLPRPMSLCCAPRGELGFLIDPIGPGTRALASLSPGEQIAVYGPLGNGYRLDVRAAAAGRRRDRNRAVPVPVGGAGRARPRCSGSAAPGTPRRRRSSRTPRS